MDKQTSYCVVTRPETECCSTSCCTPFVRHFVSAKEERERLEKYRDELRKELAGVDETIEKLKAK
jgi:hypothetical protein